MSNVNVTSYVAVCVYNVWINEYTSSGVRNCKLILPYEFDEKGTDDIIDCLRGIRRKFCWWNWKKCFKLVEWVGKRAFSNDDIIEKLRSALDSKLRSQFVLSFGRASFVEISFDSAWRSKLSLTAVTLILDFNGLMSCLLNYCLSKWAKWCTLGSQWGNLRISFIFTIIIDEEYLFTDGSKNATSGNSSKSLRSQVARR